ncbi:MAG: J domain-containing protein [Gammaproteobacteria bacterium]|nr:J domain-containing protein [Gammaproteobacteria bacterium]
MPEFAIHMDFSSMYFSNVNQIDELKGQYRRLASRYHPDRGGNPQLMTRINLEYEVLLASLKGATLREPPPRAASGRQRHGAFRERRRRFFQDVQVGETVFVNGTECEVLEVNDTAFRVVAKGRTRQTWFNKADGYCRFNRRFRAAWVKHNRRLH